MKIGYWPYDDIAPVFGCVPRCDVEPVDRSDLVEQPAPLPPARSRPLGTRCAGRRTWGFTVSAHVAARPSGLNGGTRERARATRDDVLRQHHNNSPISIAAAYEVPTTSARRQPRPAFNNPGAGCQLGASIASSWNFARSDRRRLRTAQYDAGRELDQRGFAQARHVGISTQPTSARARCASAARNDGKGSGVHCDAPTLGVPASALVLGNARHADVGVSYLLLSNHASLRRLRDDRQRCQRGVQLQRRRCRACAGSTPHRTSPAAGSCGSAGAASLAGADFW
jgi:hypothetical protein